MVTSWPWTLGPTLILLYALGQFSGLLGYFSVPDFKRVLCATGAVALFLLVVRYISPVHPVASRGIILINFLLSTVGIAGVRLGLRMARERRIGAASGQSRPRRVGIIGAGDVGETFALDMGRPIKILDLAKQMIELSGFKPDEDIKIEFVGLRPGEKLFEEISYTSESYVPTPHPKIKRFSSDPLPLEQVRNALAELEAALGSSTASQLKILLKKHIPEYQPCID